MSVLARLWDRVSGSQPLPPAWVIGLTGLLALCIVLDSRLWRPAGKVITIAHEGGHALVSVLSGRRLDGIRLHSDSSGVTYSRGKRAGPGLVLTAAAGDGMPSLLGAGAPWLPAARPACGSRCSCWSRWPPWSPAPSCWCRPAGISACPPPAPDAAGPIAPAPPRLVR